MKSLFFSISITLTLLSSGTYAQNLIAVQNGGIPPFYVQLDSAITFAQYGDTIYISV